MTGIRAPNVGAWFYSDFAIGRFPHGRGVVIDNVKNLSHIFMLKRFPLILMKEALDDL